MSQLKYCPDLGLQLTGMQDPRRVLDNVVPLCPDCRTDLAFVCSWPSRGTWGDDEVRTYECPAHGPFFFTREISSSAQPANSERKLADHGDRDSLIPARRTPTPSLDAGAVAVPEPDSEPDQDDAAGKIRLAQ